MIPHILHYCWFGGQAPGPDLVRCMATWTRLLPGWEIRCWDESNSPVGGDYCRAARRERRWSKLANYVRLWALEREGGVYLDTDVELLRPLDPLLDTGAFLGFQRREEVPGWVNNAVLGACPGHPFLTECLELTTAAWRERREMMLSPHVTTQVLRRHGLAHYGSQRLGDITIHAVEAFYPFSWLETYSPTCISADTWAIHHWKHSWAGT